MEEERFTPGPDPDLASNATPWWGLHAARYDLANRLLGEDRVLDVACGSGYGLQLLDERAARTLIGVDVDMDAARTAKAVARSGGRTCVVADAAALPFRANSFDAVVSFETIEHLTDRRTFVAEIARVLRGTGRAILSTPNAHYTEPVNGTPRNRYHVHEYTPEELHDELSAAFSSVRLLGQTRSPRFVIPPFEDAQRRLPSSPLVQARLFCWRLVNKLPMRLRDRLSRAALGRGFYPGERDYTFSEDSVAYAPDLVAMCDGRR
ncbi:MAG: class I SAM-dependent methyltransferase [Acidimicrobiales bacterium]